MKQQVHFGFNGVGELAYKRSYSRVREEDGKQENWQQTVERVVNGSFTMYKRHSFVFGIKWDEEHQA
jgi:hypothetical protein